MTTTDEEKLAVASDFSSGKSSTGVVSHILGVLADTPDEQRERKIRCTLSNIHAVARHLLGVGMTHEENDDLFVGVQPLGDAWRVQVAYAGFELRMKEPTLTEALEKTLAKLMTHVGRRLDEDTRLLAVLDPKAHSRIATRDAVEEAVRRVPGVQSVELEEPENEVGVVVVRVVPDGVMTLEARDQLVAEVGAALALSLAVLVRFRIKVFGMISTS